VKSKFCDPTSTRWPDRAAHQGDGATAGDLRRGGPGPAPVAGHRRVPGRQLRNPPARRAAGRPARHDRRPPPGAVGRHRRRGRRGAAPAALAAAQVQDAGSGRRTSSAAPPWAAPRSRLEAAPLLLARAMADGGNQGPFGEKNFFIPNLHWPYGLGRAPCWAAWSWVTGGEHSKVKCVSGVSGVCGVVSSSLRFRPGCRW
jgi:hypothetical protein